MLQIAEESARARAAELRTQHESHEAELSTLQKALRSDTIKMVSQLPILSYTYALSSLLKRKREITPRARLYRGY